MPMKCPPEQEVHYNKQVWVNPTTESIRRSECLCWNCDNLKPDRPGNCPKASALFKVITKENLALIVTRCPDWKPKS